MNLLLTMLAQNGAPTAPGPQQPPGALSGYLFMAILVGMVAFMILTQRSQRKREQQQREAMYERLAKNSRVLTIGGIKGTVVSVKGDEVVVKVDESNNTKMTFIKSAIQKILADEGETAGS